MKIRMEIPKGRDLSQILSDLDKEIASFAKVKDEQQRIRLVAGTEAIRRAIVELRHTIKTATGLAITLSDFDGSTYSFKSEVDDDKADRERAQTRSKMIPGSQSSELP